jgi:lactose/L-arabinose transport system substrate-binding protein
MKGLGYKSTIGLLLLSVLAGCSGGPDNAAGKPDSGNNQTALSATDLKGDISVAAWNDAADALEASIPGFNKKYPNVKVNIQRVTASYDKIIPPLTAGTGAPDVLQIQQRDFQNFLMKFPDQFVDYTSKLNPRKNEFAKVAWVSVEKDSKVYGVPWDLGPVGVWYRKDMFEQAGIDPKSLITWDKYISAGKQLQGKLGGKVKMTTFDATSTDYPTWWQILLHQQGGTLYNDKGEIKFTSEASIKAMNMLKKFKDEDIVFNTPTWDDRVRAVVNGSTATVIYPVWYAGTLRTQAKDQKGKWGVMPLPAFTEGGPNQANSGGSLLAVSSQSQKKDAAWAFIEYNLLSNEGQDTQMKFGLFPSWQPYYQTEGFKKTDEFFGFAYADFFASVSNKIPELNYGPHFLDFKKPLLDAFGGVMNGGKSPEAALKDAEAQSAKATGLKVAP